MLPAQLKLIIEAYTPKPKVQHLDEVYDFKCLCCNRPNDNYVKIRTLDLLYYSQVLYCNQHIQVHNRVMYIFIDYLFMF